ncbi:hypothetical protein D9757_012992 [Collybiopsis confluens]|uniref:MYND-type domain-containing protein n=1 Tax=Collybiopsis confluens TaxID=2823264 RepID=A0A8H5GID0_9AGAR|nr:hypothetical protein D9757_012992 [Collybiopsis confluens]
MNKMLQLLKRKALSDREGSEEALLDLCKLVRKLNTKQFTTFLPLFGKFLGQENSTDSSEVNNLALEVLWTMAVGIGKAKPGEGYCTTIQSSLLNSWSSIHHWTSILISSVESEFQCFGELGDVGFHVLHKLALFYGALFEQQFLQRPDSTSASMLVEPIARVLVCTLAVPGFPGGGSSELTLETLECARTIFRGANGTRTAFWVTLLTASIDKIVTPNLADLISQRLIQVSHQEFDIMLLKSWFCVLGHTMALSAPLNQALLQRRSVIFVVPLLRRVGNSICNRRTGSPFNLSLWQSIIRFFWHSCIFGGHSCVKAVIKAGILPILWKFSTVVKVKPPFTEEGLYADLIYLFGSSTLYRSVQKSLERNLHKSPLAEINAEEEYLSTTSSRSHSIWGRFKQSLISRIDIRKKIEQQVCLSKINPPVKLYRCGGCHLAFYCGLECQKVDWNQHHRLLCQASTDESKDGLSCIPDERDTKIMEEIAKVESWHIRDDLLAKWGGQESSINDSDKEDSIPIFELDFTRGPIISQQVQYTVKEAREKNPTGEWDYHIQEYLHERARGNYAGGLLKCTLPGSGASGGDRYSQHVLSTPTIFRPEAEQQMLRAAIGMSLSQNRPLLNKDSVL